MATLDFAATGDAIAGRWAPSIVTPPAGLGNIRYSTADLPNRLSLLPVMLLFPDSGELAPGNGSRLVDERWFARFYFAKQDDLPRETRACSRWLGILIDQIRVGEVAGTSPPTAVIRVKSYRIGTLPYAQVDYTGIELVVSAAVTHGWSA